MLQKLSLVIYIYKMVLELLVITDKQLFTFQGGTASEAQAGIYVSI